MWLLVTRACSSKGRGGNEGGSEPASLPQQQAVARVRWGQAVGVAVRVCSKGKAVRQTRQP